jgi:protease-4
MAINADTFLDRLYLKSQIKKWRLLAVVFGVLALIVLVEKNSPHSPIENPFIARLTFEGIIEDDQLVYDLIDDVAENNKAKAVVVWLNTPGGSAVGGEEVFERLRKVAEKKPVVAVMRSVAASAGYMIALGADHIVAREGTITGSIGALMETAEFTELAKKLGVEPLVIKSGPLKASPNPLEKTTPEAARVVQDVINDFYGRFVDMVATRRSLPREKVVQLADGRIYSGKGALEHKLIDAIGGEDEALNWLVEQRKISPELEIRDMVPEENIPFFDRMAQSFAGYFWQNSRLGLDGLRAIWHPTL